MPIYSWDDRFLLAKRKSGGSAIAVIWIDFHFSHGKSIFHVFIYMLNSTKLLHSILCGRIQAFTRPTYTYIHTVFAISNLSQYISIDTCIKCFDKHKVLAILTRNRTRLGIYEQIHQYQSNAVKWISGLRY